MIELFQKERPFSKGSDGIGTAGDGAQKVGAVGPVDQPSALLQGLEAAESEGVQTGQGERARQ